MAEKPANLIGVKQRDDGKLQKGQERTEGLVERVGKSVVRNADLLRKLVGR